VKQFIIDKQTDQAICNENE